MHCSTFRAGVVVLGHGSRIGHDTRTALQPAVPVHHLFHGEGGDAAQHRLAKRTAQDLVDPTALRLGLLSLLSSCWLVITAEHPTEEIVKGVVVGLAVSAGLLLRHAAAKQPAQQPAEHVVRAKSALPGWCLAWLRVWLRLGHATPE